MSLSRIGSQLDEEGNPLKAKSRAALLTFDVEGPPKREDFINEDIIQALYHVLRLLAKYDLRGLFFITGTAAKKISCYPKILKMLESHEVGYHSSSHSIKPGIFEYTDVKSYEKAVRISIERETSSIDSFAGGTLGHGGIISLKQVFPNKKIASFRAPFLCWSPPHLEALRELGISFDFSADLSSVPVFYRSITFFPYPIVIDSVIGKLYYLLRGILKREFSVLLMHPSLVLFKEGGPFYGAYRNAYEPIRTENHSSFVSRFKFCELELFFCALILLQKLELVETRVPLNMSRKSLDLGEKDVLRIYKRSLSEARKHFGYKPRFLWCHFLDFFEFQD